nr:zinc finger, CCHC-type [Tanacetum cinerariifolium]GEX99685.1 zinc finger, CCHC-type [Tanacetum cinerariifolium]
MLKGRMPDFELNLGTKLGDHIDEFSKLILDLANIDIEIVDEDQALMLLMLLPSFYENFVETMLYRKESLTMEEVLATLNSRELKKRTGDTKRETGTGLYVRGRSSEKRVSNEKSNGFVKKGKHDQVSDSSNEEGNTYFGEALVVGRNDEMTELVMNSGGSYHMTHKRDLLYDFKVVDGSSVQLGDNMTCTIKGIGKVKIQLHDGSRFILEDANIMVTGVPGQEDADGNVVGKKKVKEYMKAPNLTPTSRDIMYWRDSINGFSIYSVRRAWEALRPRGNEVNWYHNVWFPHCIPRYAFPLWLVMRNRLKTQDKLKQWENEAILLARTCVKGSKKTHIKSEFTLKPLKKKHKRGYARIATLAIRVNPIQSNGSES